MNEKIAGMKKKIQETLDFSGFREICRTSIAKEYLVVSAADTIRMYCEELVNHIETHEPDPDMVADLSRFAETLTKALARSYAEYKDVSVTPEEIAGIAQLLQADEDTRVNRSKEFRNRYPMRIYHEHP